MKPDTIKCIGFFYVRMVKLGKHNEFKPRFLRVRIPIWIQKYALMSKLVKLVVLETMENYDTLPVRFRLRVQNMVSWLNWLDNGLQTRVCGFESHTHLK